MLKQNASEVSFQSNWWIYDYIIYVPINHALQPKQTTEFIKEVFVFNF